MPTTRANYPQKIVTGDYTLTDTDANSLIRVQCDGVANLPIIITVPPNTFNEGDIIGIFAAHTGYPVSPAPVIVRSAPGFTFGLSPEAAYPTELKLLNSGFVWFMIQDGRSMGRVYDHSGLDLPPYPFSDVRLDSSGRLPQVDGSQLVNLPFRAINTPTETIRGGVYSVPNRVGYYLAGLNSDGHFIVQPLPKSGCCDDGNGSIGDGGGDNGGGDNGGGNTGGGTTTTNFQIPTIGGTPVNGPTGTEPNIIYDSVNNDLYIWDTNPPPSRWVKVGGYSAGGGSPGGSSGDPSIPIVGGKPTAPPDGGGNIVWDTINGQLWIWNGAEWVTHHEAMTPNTPPSVGIGSALPATGNEGDAFFNTSNDQLYIWTGGQWKAAQAVTAPDAPDGVRFVTSLPPLPDPAYPNSAVVLNKSDNKMWENRNGTWTEIPLTPHIAAGSITAGMIQAGAIGATQANIDSLAAGILTANRITAGMIAAGAIGANQIQAGAITSDKIATNAITVGTAQIADASITTLKVAGEAINVIRSIEYQAVIKLTPGLPLTPSGSGVGGQELLRLSFTMPQQGKVFITFSGNVIQYAPPPIADNRHYQDSGAYWIAIDGVDQIGWYLRDVNSVTGVRTLTAGPHVATVYAFGTPADLNAEIGNMALIIHGALR